MTKETGSIPPQTILAQGSSTSGPERVQEIAIEVERLCGAVRRSASAIAFNDEPCQFRILLERKAR
jgi:hypothetical protein